MITATDGTAFTGAVTVAVTGDAGTQATGSVGSGACTHEGNGYHTYAPAQAETNYNLVAFTFTGTGAIPVTVQVYTRPTTGILAPTVADRTLDVSTGGEAGLDWANIGGKTTSNALTATTVSTSQVVASVTTKTGYSLVAGTGLGNQTANITGNLTGSVGSVTGNVGGNVTGSVGSLVGHTVQTGDSFALANGATGFAAIDTVVDAILIDTNELQLNQGNWLTVSAADVRIEMDSNSTQLAAILADTNELQADDVPGLIAALNDLSAADVDARLAAYDGPTNAEMAAAFTEVKGATWSSGTDTLEQIRDRGDAAWVTGGGGTAADIADAVWTELIADHSGVSGSTAESLSLAQSAGDPWATPIPGAYGAGTAGYVVGVDIKTKTDSISGGAFTVTNRMNGTEMQLFVGEQYDFTIQTTVDYTGVMLELAWEDRDNVLDIASIADGDLTKTPTSVTFTIPASVTETVRKLNWSLRDVDSGDKVLIYGLCKVSVAAHAD